MDFLTLISYVLAIVETGALIATLVYVTKAMKAKKTKKGKKGREDKTVQLTDYYRNAGIFFFVYLVLNIIRNFSGIFQ